MSEETVPVARDPKLEGYNGGSLDKRGHAAHEAIVREGVKSIERITGQKPTEDQVRRYVASITEKTDQKMRNGD